MYNPSPSCAQRAFLARRKRIGRLVSIYRYALLLIILAGWEMLTRYGALDPFIFSSPSRIAATIAQLGSGLLVHIGTTLLETVLGFLLGTLLGVLAAIALWWFPTIARILDPYLVILNALPKIVLGPILIVWLGSGLKTIVTIAVLVSIIVTITSVLNGFTSVDQEKLLLMRSLGASRLQALHMVVLPASVPTIVAALKLNVGMSWVGVIVGEFLISRAGLGYLSVYGGQIFKLDLVMTSVVILCILAALMYYAVVWFEKRVNQRDWRN